MQPTYVSCYHQFCSQQTSKAGNFQKFNILFKNCLLVWQIVPNRWSKKCTLIHEKLSVKVELLKNFQWEDFYTITHANMSEANIRIVPSSDIELTCWDLIPGPLACLW